MKKQEECILKLRNDFSITDKEHRYHKKPWEVMLTMIVDQKLLGALSSSDFADFDL